MSGIGGMVEYTKSERNILLLACCIATFITPLLSTMMNLSLVNIGEEFGVGSHSLAYVNTSYLLASVIFMVPFAKAGDIWGKKRILMLGIVIIAVSSLIAVFSPSFWFLIACRAMVGAGAAAVTCTSMSMIADVFPVEMRGGAIGMQTMCVYIGLAVGPPIGGALNDLLGWHSLFYMMIPICVASLALIMLFRKEISPDAGSRFDANGTVLYGIGIFLSMLGVINMPAAWSFASLIVGIVFMILFVRSQIGNPYHLLNVEIFRNRTFSGSCLAAFMSYAASYSITFFMAMYLQSIGSLTATQAGFLMLVQPAVQAVGTPLFGRLSDKVADKRILPTSGMLFTALGLVILMMLGETMSLAVVVLALLTVGFGFSLFSAPNTSVIMSSVHPSETGEASAMVSVTRQTGMMISMGIAMLFIALIMGSADNLSPETYGDFLLVMKVSFGVCLVMCLIGAVASALRGKTIAPIR